MFDELLKTVSVDIATVRAIIQTNEQLRIIIFSKASATKPELLENPEFNSLLNVVPDERNWQIYDHCAVVTRLYAIYEKFVKNLISDWLALLPDLVPNYSNLDKKIQDTHQEGVGILLRDLKNNDRFDHLSPEKVVRSLFSAITDNENYELIPDAFTLHKQNLRKEALEQLFVGAGIKNVWEWVINHRDIKNFVDEVRGRQNTAEGELKQLVKYRNEAAHGLSLVDQTLGTEDLLILGDFVEALCKALAELVSYHVISKKFDIGKAKEIGTIRQWLDDIKVARAKVKEVTLSIGDSLFLVKENSSYCQLVTIESIRDKEIPKDKVEITDEKDIHLKFDRDARKGLSLYVIE